MEMFTTKVTHYKDMMNNMHIFTCSENLYNGTLIIINTYICIYRILVHTTVTYTYL